MSDQQRSEARPLDAIPDHPPFERWARTSGRFMDGKHYVTWDWVEADGCHMANFIDGVPTSHRVLLSDGSDE